MKAGLLARREFLRVTAAASCLPLLTRHAWAAMSECDRTTWYRNAKFGMFIHWAPYSQASVEASWPIMRPKPGGISEADYVGLAKTFNPVKYDPQAFVDLARAAGQKYMVFTTKHHDGFCMFDSAYTDYKVTRAPYGRDIVAMLAKACDADGMPLGFYYSPPDMHHPDFRDTSRPAKDNWNGEPQRPQWPGYLQYMQLQLTELLTRYGPVALIWFDGLNHQEKYDGTRVLEMIHRLQPRTLVNDRIGVKGDYETPEQFIPTSIPTKEVVISGTEAKGAGRSTTAVPRPEDFQLWETCMTINNTWAYNRNDRDYKSARTLIRSLIEVASRGGNFLLNVGPQPDGQIQPEFQQRLRAVGDWLNLNGDAIYGTTYGPIQGASAFRTTAKDKDLYIHYFDWPGSAAEIAGIESRVLSARMLADGRPLTFRQTDTNLHLDLPAQASDENASVVALRLY